MCRNIKNLFNFDPPATEEEITDAALQFVRKLSGFQKPSQVNEQSFYKAVELTAQAASELLNSLVTTSHPHNREVEAIKARQRSIKRFGNI